MPLSCLPVQIGLHPYRVSKRAALSQALGASILAAFAVSTVATSAQTTVQATQPDSVSAAQPVLITLDEALKRARSSEPTYATALADSKVAGLDKSIARAGLLPSAHYNGQGIYSQPNGLYAEGGEGVITPNPKFVSNDARPREYISQGIVEETLSLG